MGFDISARRVPGQTLVSGHNKLQAFLPEIARYLSTVPRLCCTNTPVQSNLAYRVVSVDGRVLYDFNFEAHDEDVLRKVMSSSLSESTSFNSAMLRSFQEKFRAQSGAGVKVSGGGARNSEPLPEQRPLAYLPTAFRQHVWR